MATIHRTHLNYRELGPEMEENTMPSETQPDQVLSIKEMLMRHVRGLPIDGARDQGAYYDDLYIPDIKTLDLTEIQEHRDYFKERVQEMQEFLSKTQEPAEGGKPKTSGGQPASDSDPEPKED